MHPGIDIQGTIQEHVDAAVHRIAMKAAIAFHVLSSIENKKSCKYFDVALWYAHDDFKVLHQCLAIKVFNDFIENVTRHCAGARDQHHHRRNIRHPRQNMR